jgi:hypothetical protein
MKEQTKTRLLAMTFLLGAMTAPAAMADCRKRINLHPAVAGDWSGKAEVRQQGGQQQFKVSMDARVADGTTYIVSANGLAVGSITIRLGDGELQLSNSNGKMLPQGAQDVCSVGPVSVIDSDRKTLLTGSFQ